MPRGKKELAEPLILRATLVEVPLNGLFFRESFMGPVGGNQKPEAPRRPAE